MSNGGTSQWSIPIEIGLGVFSGCETSCHPPTSSGSTSGKAELLDRQYWVSMEPTKMIRIVKAVLFDEISEIVDFFKAVANFIISLLIYFIHLSHLNNGDRPPSGKA